MNFKRILKHILVILSLAIISGLVYNLLVEDTISPIYHPPEFKPGTHLSLDQAYDMYKQGRALFIDTRYKEEFQKNHIKNAVNLPSRSSMNEIMGFLQNISKEKIIITYCSNPNCPFSIRMAGFLRNQNFANVFIYLGGLDEWMAHNLPVEAYDQKNN